MNRHLRDDQAWDFFRRLISKKIVPTLASMFVIMVIVGVMAAGFESDNVHQHNQLMNARAHMVNVFNAKNVSPADRKTLARNALQLTDSGLDLSSIDNGTTDYNQELVEINELEKVASSGDRLRLYVSFKNWSGFYHTTLPLLVIGDLLLMSLVAFLIYAVEAQDRGEYLIDFKWKEVWPVFFVLATMLPIGWGFYLVSWFRLHRLEVGDDEQTYDGEAVVVVQPVRFKSAPAEARRFYIELREHLWRKRMEGQIEELRVKSEEHSEALRKLGDKIRETQGNKGEVEAEIRRLESLDIDSLEIPEREHLNAEFDRLLALPGVKGVRVKADCVSLLLHARLEYKGRKYDLGDWDIRVGQRDQMVTRELRSGVNSDWGGGAPVYRISGGFCFGSREYLIERHLAKGQLLEAVELAVDAMQSVNDEDVDCIHDAFREVAIA